MDAIEKRGHSNSDTTQTTQSSPPKKVKFGVEISSSQEDCSRWSTSSQDGVKSKETVYHVDANSNDEESKTQDGIKSSVDTSAKAGSSGAGSIGITETVKVIGDSPFQDVKSDKEEIKTASQQHKFLDREPDSCITSSSSSEQMDSNKSLRFQFCKEGYKNDRVIKFKSEYPANDLEKAETSKNENQTVEIDTVHSEDKLKNERGTTKKSSSDDVMNEQESVEKSIDNTQETDKMSSGGGELPNQQEIAKMSSGHELTKEEELSTKFSNEMSSDDKQANQEESVQISDNVKLTNEQETRKKCDGNQISDDIKLTNEQKAMKKCDVNQISDQVCSGKLTKEQISNDSDINNLGTNLKESEDFEESFESKYSSVYTTSSSDYTDTSEDDLIIDLEEGRQDENALPDIQMQSASTAFEKSKMMSEKKSVLGYPEKKLDPDEISAFQREKYVMLLMQTLKSSIFYDSFCYAFPKSKEIDSVYRYKVKSISDFLNVVQKQDFTSKPASYFPTYSSLYHAEGIIEDLKKRYNIFDEGTNIDETEDAMKHGSCSSSQCTTYSVTDGCPEDQSENLSTEAELSGNKDTSVERDKISTDSKSGSTESGSNSNKSGMSKDMSKLLEKEMDNDIPHNTVFVFGGKNGCIKSSWAGQFLVTINPIVNSLLVKFFTFIPDYDQEVHNSFAAGKFTDKVWKEMKKNLQLFEVSRQLCVSLPLTSVVNLKMLVSESNNSEGILWLKCRMEPTFHQRFIHTTASLLNQWQERESFLSVLEMGKSVYDLYLGGTTEELSDILALIVTCESRLKEMLHSDSYSETDLHSSSNNENVTTGKQNAEIKDDRILDQLPEESKKRRLEILQILLDHRLVSLDQFEDVLESQQVSGNWDVKENQVSNFLANLSGLHECLSDFVNFHCMDVSELEHHLSTPLNASACGMSPSNFDFTCTVGPYEEEMTNRATDNSPIKSSSSSSHSTTDSLPNINTMKVTEFLKLQKSPSVFFSFCNGCLQKENQTWHCDVCRKCVDWRTWHCVRCNNCSQGTSDSICEFCGSYGFDRTIIKPLSIFIDDLKDDTFLSSNEKWNMTITKNDIIDWPDTCKESDDVNAFTDIQFNLKDMMSDKLGLIDPVAFLLGTSARGIESRHERIRLKYKKKEKPTAQLPCVIQ